jgi:hypothetical protein
MLKMLEAKNENLYPIITIKKKLGEKVKEYEMYRYYVMYV